MNTTSKKTQFSYLDEDAMSSASALTGSATKVPTQQSVKAYVDTTAEGLHVLEACTLATTADLNYVYANGTAGVGATLTNGSTGVISIDGTALTVNIRILVKDQAGGDNDQNGIYKVTTAGAVDVALVLTREPDFDTYISSYEGDAADIRLGDFVFISSGAVNIGHGFVMTGNSKFKKLGDGVVGTDSIEFTQFSGLSETVAVNQGGTGATSLTTDGVLFGNGTSAISAVDLSTNGNVIVGGSTPAAVTGANLAGAGLSATVGNGTLVLNGEDASTSAKGIASFSSDNFAVSSGAVTIKNAGISLTAEVTGTLAVGNGGTGLSSIADNSILHTTSSNTLAALTAPKER
jgi:hypothetical protein